MIISIISIILIIIIIHDIHSNCDHLSQNYLSLKKLLSLVLIVEVLVTLGGRAGLASTLVGIILLFICLKSPISVSNLRYLSHLCHWCFCAEVSQSDFFGVVAAALIWAEN